MFSDPLFFGSHPKKLLDMDKKIYTLYYSKVLALLKPMLEPLCPYFPYCQKCFY